MNLKNQRDLSHDIDNPDTDNATYFLGKDASLGSFEADYRKLDKQEHFKHLKKLNSGWNTGLNWYNNRLNTYQMAKDAINAISGQLDLTDKERSRARDHYVNLDREKLGLKAQLVAYCVCAYVVENNDRNQNRRSHPNVPDEATDDLFQEVADSIGLCQKSIVKTYCKIASRLPEVSPIVQGEYIPDSHIHEDIGGGI